MVVDVVLGPMTVVEVVPGIDVEVVDAATVVEVEPGAIVVVVTAGHWLQSSVQSGLQAAQPGKTPPAEPQGKLPKAEPSHCSPGSRMPLWLHWMVVDVVLGPMTVVEVVPG